MHLKQSIDQTIAILDDVIVFDPSDNPRNKRQSGVPVHNKKRTKDLQYAFDRVLPGNCSQQQVYEVTAAKSLDGVLDGINATIFAYGATGAGKTFTIIGTPSNPGIMPLTMVELFKRIDQCANEKLTKVSVSFLEVYNETVRDLLATTDNGASLEIREDSANRISVPGLSEHHPSNEAEVMELLDRGASNRICSATGANEVSSRSHAVFQINIQQRDRIPGLETQVKVATLTLCDLAGSERASATENRGQLLREGANINRSLLALGNCINALCDPNKRTSHIPYRDSKLTRLLKYSLSGNCRTVIIANICPSIQHYEETHNTLKYAWRAKQIRVSVERNVVDVKYHIGQYVQLIEELRAEITALKQQPQPPYPISKPAILAIAWDSIIQFAQHNCDHRVSIAALHKRLDDFKRIHQLNSFAADADLSSIIARTIEICTSSSSVDISDLLSAWIDEENNKESPPVKLAPAPPSPPVVQMSILSKQTAKPSSAKARRHSYLPRRSSMIPQITVVPPAAPLKLPAIVPGKLKGRKKRMSMIPLPRFNAETAQSRMSSIIPSTTSKAFTQQKQQQQQHPPSPPVLLQDEQELSDISKMLNNIDLLLDNLEVKTADEPEKCDSLADKSPNKLDFPSPLVKRTTMPSRPEIVEEKEDNDETPRPRRIVSSALRTVVDGRKTPENNPNIGNVVIRTACYSSTPVRRRNVWQDRFIPSTAIKPRQLNQSADIAKGQSGVQKMISATTPRTPNRQQPLIHSERELDQFIAEQVVNTPRALPK